MKPRIPLYEDNPVHAGSGYLQVVVKQQVVPNGYEHEGKLRYVRYEVEGILGIVEQTEPFKTSRGTGRAKPKFLFNTLEEAEAAGDEIEAEYLKRGWHHYHFAITDFE
ncbi:MAG TPA: hypothetical protein VE178_21160 [Silvibacterium sp.]|nr:hypothetical protein [Silvibacterium sp.]